MSVEDTLPFVWFLPSSGPFQRPPPAISHGKCRAPKEQKCNFDVGLSSTLHNVNLPRFMQCHLEAHSDHSELPSTRGDSQLVWSGHVGK